MVYAKKSLGQNFLQNTTVLEAIADAGRLIPGEVVLEIGPGEGALTEVLLSRGVKVIAIEKDDRLISMLTIHFESYIRSGHFVLIHDDVIEWWKKPEAQMLVGKKYKLIANIPYYITGLIIRTFLESQHQPTDMVLMVQKEVAERVMARDAKESILSLSIKAYGVPEYVMTVKAGNFRPAPNVDSAVLAIHAISKQFFTHISEKLFFEVLHDAFRSKRKKLISNIKPLFEACKKSESDTRSLASLFAQCGISEDIRAEDMTLGQWNALLAIFQGSSLPE